MLLQKINSNTAEPSYFVNKQFYMKSMIVYNLNIAKISYLMMVKVLITNQSSILSSILIQYIIF